MLYVGITVLTAIYGLSMASGLYRPKRYYRKSFLSYVTEPFSSRFSRILGFFITIWGILFVIDAIASRLSNRENFAGVFLLGVFVIMFVMSFYAYREVGPIDIDES
jgi:hypothetical protein